jgi:hypothetical protein
VQAFAAAARGGDDDPVEALAGDRLAEAVTERPSALDARVDGNAQRRRPLLDGLEQRHAGFA